MDESLIIEAVAVRSSGLRNPTEGSTMLRQAMSRGIRARTRAAIRIGGEQGRAAVFGCFLAGITARGLSWRFDLWDAFTSR
jgi:hypothetical protein